ncbi:uncharacterized protein SCDLUD_002924 [Saccharomycodes ludwigii]|uniref:uncharacterized protein n=1 Tax=Saccharomycodes ludwigii TaxID=36035 RepID=UPI001E8AF8F9|nr:hypothetical protein SCDLUD_002924 [Saccharomycodes ludwigii]KAH3901431.1 hypothetical protein SCDLUD_002924 [Saccharomycodes ludwigii]
MGTGFILAKANILTAEATKIISQIVLIVLLPCLSFNKIVANIEDKDIKDVGIICLSSILIFGTGLFFAWVVRCLLPVPKKWYGGILAGGMFPNISDLPIAYLQTMDTGLIFTEAEGEKGVACVIIFMAMWMICVFNLGGFLLIEMDFNYKDEESADYSDVENSSSKEIANDDSSSKNSSSSKINDTTTNLHNAKEDSSNSSSLPIPTPDVESLESTISSIDSSTPNLKPNDNIPDTKNNKVTQPAEKLIQGSNKNTKNANKRSKDPVQYTSKDNNTNAIMRRRSLSTLSHTSSVTPSSTKIPNPTGMDALIRHYSRVDQFGNDLDEDGNNVSNLDPNDGDATDNNNTKSSDSVASNKLQKVMSSHLARMVTQDAAVRKKDIEASGKSKIIPNFMKNFKILNFFLFFLKNCLRPCSIAVILALIICFIPWVKALFVTAADAPRIRQAPDEEPALNFFMDFTSYVGAASVPFGLLLLGGTLGSLEIKDLYPGFWKSAVVLVFLRQCIMPIFGVLWCERLIKAGWLNIIDDKMLLFVIVIDWALPSMTTIIYFTASYTPLNATDTTQMDCVSFFLLLQYPLLVVSLPFLVTYYIKVQLKL